MKILKTIILAVVLVVILHIVTVLSLSDSKIFPCQISLIGGNMQMSEWQDSMCDVNYKYWVGSVQRLTPGATMSRIGLAYVLPILVTIGIMYGLQIRQRRIEMTMR